MLLRRHSQADGIDVLCSQRVEIGDHLRTKFRSYFARTLGIRVDNSDKFGALKPAPHADVVPAEASHTDDGHANQLFAHDFVFSSGGSGANACIAIPASSAARIKASRSKSSVRPASIPRAVAFERRMTSIVFIPITGTSNRMSCRGLLTFTTTTRCPPAMRAARSIVSSVP